MAQVSFRIDDNIKAKAESACAAMGMTMSAAINIFLTKVAEGSLLRSLQIRSIAMNILRCLKDALQT